ncbi:hypothetical protein [Neolewinella agarilytica]|uniref:hypothetical protein n=1 Tax=Neolewinella agarilytica TaxID=478744 RepID=UPI0015873A55|nr:hypothetical protein [Neolewinella agarilytica]
MQTPLVPVQQNLHPNDSMEAPEVNVAEFGAAENRKSMPSHRNKENRVFIVTYISIKI